MTTAPKGLQWVTRIITNGIVLILLFAISFTLIGLDMARTNHTSQQQAKLAREQAQQAQQQSDHLRVVVCGIVETVLAVPSSSPPTPRSDAFNKAFTVARSPQGANCTPDLQDGK